MFGLVWRYFLIATVISTALTRRDEDVEYSPWCSYRVPVRLIIMRPRLSPCERHKRFNCSRLYLCLLLLLLAGDVELNPGPTKEADSVTSKANEVYNGPNEPACVSCGMKPTSLTLRSRPIRNTIVKCADESCKNSIHDQCKSADDKGQHINWKCPNHSVLDSDPTQQTGTDTASTESSRHQSSSPATEGTPGPASHPPSLAVGEKAQQPPPQQSSSPADKDTRKSAAHHSSLTDDITRGSTPQQSSSPADRDISKPAPHQTSPPADRDTPGSAAHSPSEPLPGPSFISASLMDVMEAVRMTQVSLDHLVKEVSQLKQLVQSLQHQGRQGVEHTPTANRPAVSEEQRPLPCPQVQQHPTSRPFAGGQQCRRQEAAKPSLLIIGDSNVRRLEGASYRQATRPTFHSIPGATTDHVGRDLGQVVSRCDATEVVFHVGTNDVTRKGSEEVVKDVLSLAQTAKG